MDAPDFLIKFPEFKLATLELIQAHLDDALLQIDATVWGDKVELGQGYLAAHTLALSPFGQQARIQNKDGVTTYWKNYRRLLMQVAPRGMVL